MLYSILEIALVHTTISVLLNAITVRPTRLPTAFIIVGLIVANIVPHLSLSLNQ